jgi:hypothetical protein
LFILFLVLLQIAQGNSLMISKFWLYKLGTLLVIAGLVLSLSTSTFAQSAEVDADAANTEQADVKRVSNGVFLPLMQNDSATDVTVTDVNTDVMTGALPETESLSPMVEAAALAAATICPPSSFPNTINHAQNWSFETVGPKGSPVSCQKGCQVSSPSAAANWMMHSNNAGAPVFSELVTTDVPGPGGHRMLHFIANGGESGVYQLAPWPQSEKKRLMFSVWVYVKRGQVLIQANGGATGPAAYSTKLNEWEQLRVCTDGTVFTDLFLIYNQVAGAGEFYADRVEVRDMSPQ